MEALRLRDAGCFDIVSCLCFLVKGLGGKYKVILGRHVCDDARYSDSAYDVEGRISCSKE